MGALLARAEVEIAVNQLLDAFPAMDFADGTPPTDAGVFTRGPEQLWVRLVPADGWARASED